MTKMSVADTGNKAVNVLAREAVNDLDLTNEPEAGFIQLEALTAMKEAYNKWQIGLQGIAENGKILAIYEPTPDGRKRFRLYLVKTSSMAIEY